MTTDVGSCEEVLPGPELQETHPTPQSDYTYWSSADMPRGPNLTSVSQEEDVYHRWPDQQTKQSVTLEWTLPSYPWKNAAHTHRWSFNRIEQ